MEHKNKTDNPVNSGPVKSKDSAHEGKDNYFMTLDSWNQDGNFYARFDEFGPVMEQEEPPAHNGKPTE